MSGRRQHFIPRKYLKQFVDKNSNDQVWLHRKSMDRPILTGLMNVAQQRDFNSTPTLDKGESLDDRITSYESDVLYVNLEKINCIDDGCNLDSEITAEIAVHLSARNANTRGIFVEGMKNLSELLSRILNSPELLIDLKKLPTNKVPAKVKSLLFEVVEESNLEELTNISVEAIIRLTYFIIRERADDLIAGIANSAPGLVFALQELGPKRAYGAHRDMLSKSMAPEARLNELKKFKWTVNYLEGAILPDCVCIAQEESGSWHPLFFSGNEKIKVVIFPISANKIAVGQRDFDEKYDNRTYNVDAISACSEFFLSSKPYPDLIDNITAAGVKFQAEFFGIMEEALESVRREFIETDKSSSEYETKTIISEERTKDDPSFSVNFEKFAEEKIAIDITNEIKNVISRSLLKVNMIGVNIYDRIDGITITDDYVEAVYRVDRGYEEAVPIILGDSLEQQGLAIPISVLRDGVVRRHIVVRANLAYALVSNQVSTKQISEEILCNLFVGEILFDRLARQFTGYNLGAIENPLDAFLSHHASGYLRAYFVGRYGFTKKEELIYYEDEIADTFEKAFAETYILRKNYYNDRDVNTIYLNVANYVEKIVEKISFVIGLRDQFEIADGLSIKLMRWISELELESWINLYSCDLRGIDEEHYDKGEYTDIIFQNRHFERILFVFGLIVDDMKTEGIYVHLVPVPYLGEL